MIEPPIVAVQCDHCHRQGVAGAQIVPYSIARGVEAWLHHGTCSKVERDPAWRAAFARKKRAERGEPDGPAG